MRAVKGNRVYTISEREKQHYQDIGFDILDDANNVIAYGRGKTVPYGDYVALQDKCVALQAEIDALRAENESLKEQKPVTSGMDATAAKTVRKSGK